MQLLLGSFLCSWRDLGFWSSSRKEHISSILIHHIWWAETMHANSQWPDGWARPSSHIWGSGFHTLNHKYKIQICRWCDSESRLDIRLLFSSIFSLMLLWYPGLSHFVGCVVDSHSESCLQCWRADLRSMWKEARGLKIKFEEVDLVVVFRTWCCSSTIFFEYIFWLFFFFFGGEWFGILLVVLRAYFWFCTQITPGRNYRSFRDSNRDQICVRKVS